MSMVSFMPWCRIDKAYDVGEVKILPFERHKPIDGLDEAAQCRVNTILATYKTIESRSVDRAAIVRYAEKSPIDDLDEKERETVHELADLARFCGLARREYSNPHGFYCNSSCFNLYIQKFDRADHIALTTRRRDGETWSGWPIDNIVITIPTHCHTVREVRLDEALLTALTAYRKQTRSDGWVRWQNALSCFNQANTDDEQFRPQVEWVLLASAFEHLLGAKSISEDVANEFSKILIPQTELLARDANRRSDRWTRDGVPLRYEWMREFYRVRGDYAHGKLNTQQPTVWKPFEHLMLATIGFPLIVKGLLQKACVYTLTEDDNAQIDSFEQMANTADFLTPPSDQKNDLDSHWSRLCGDCKSKFVRQRMVEEIEAEGLLPREDKSTGVEDDVPDGEAE